MNAPERHHPTKGEQPGGREAAEANRKLVERQTVRLELDVQERDKYGRLLGSPTPSPTSSDASRYTRVVSSHPCATIA